MTAYINQPLVEQLLKATREVALDVEVVSEATLESFDKALHIARKYQSLQPRQRHAKKLDDLYDVIAPLGRDELLKLSRLMAVSSIVVNGIENFNAATSHENAETRFYNVINELIGDDDSDRNRRLDHLAETMDSLLISLVYTMHPVVFHTPEARKGEQYLSSRLEGMREEIERNAKKLPKQFLEDFKEKMGINVEQLALGATVTPFEQVTIASEAQTEAENMERIDFQIPRVIEAWNNAITRIATEQPALSGRLEQVKITPERAKKMLEQRTWNWAADADGRKFATSMALYGGVQRHITEDRRFTGPKLDLRQNAEMHRDYISALIQVKWNEDEAFAQFCTEFIEQRNIHTSDEGWLSPKQSIFQQLPEHDRAELLKQILQRGFDLKPEEIDAETLRFNVLYFKVFNALLESHGYAPDTTFNKLTSEHKRELRSILKKEGFRISRSGLSYHTIGKEGTGVLLFNEAQKLNRIPSKNNGPDTFELGEIPDSQKRVLLDIPKRLAIIKDTIDRFGDAVADRHQIANFSSAADFYAMMMLFQQHGLLRVVDGIVVGKPQLGIQPLLETVEDMKHAKEIFHELLKDPLVRSYYKERGVAELMLGFSDGSKSAGNFASQWQIYKTSRELHQLFSKEFEAEIAAGQFEIRFLQGRGRGMDRGGTLEIGTAQKLLPAEVASAAVFDITIQGDQPMNMAASPSTSQDALASMMVGTITASMDAKRPRTERELGDLAAYEKAIDIIATESERVFVETVKKDPKALKFVKGVPLNAQRTSRSAKRGAGSTMTDWDGTRAIEIEYGFNLPELLAHDVGLRAGIQKFLDSEMFIPDPKDASRGVSGMAALKILYEKHPFFRSQIDIRLASYSQNYDPNLAQMYGTMSGTSEFVAKVTEQNSGLGARLREIAGKSTRIENNTSSITATTERDDGAPVNALTALSTIGHTIVRLFKGKRPDREHDPDGAKIVNNASFCCAMKFAHPSTPAELRKNAEVGAGRAT